MITIINYNLLKIYNHKKISKKLYVKNKNQIIKENIRYIRIFKAMKICKLMPTMKIKKTN